MFEPSPHAVFALQVNMQPNSQLYALSVYIDNGRTLTYKKNLTRDEFVKYASGKWPSIYNPERVNLLEENHLKCGLTKDEITKKDIVYCSPLDSIWKIRFSDYPFNTGKEKGWSQELYKPSSKQIIFLHEQYKISDLDGFFIGDYFWEILRDVQDPTWIQKYKNLK